MNLLSPQLQAFMMVVKYHTVHAAAAELHLTQTAVTQRIRTLETSLKTTLFIRSRRGMQLTAEGQALLRYCQASVELEGEALATIQGAGSETEIELRITGPTSMMHSRVIPRCVPLMQRFAGLLFYFKIDDVDTHHQKLRSGEADFALIREEQLTAEMQSKSLAAEEYVLVASQQWQSRSLQEIIAEERIIDFDESDQITFNYLKQYDLFSYSRKRRLFVNRTDDLAMLAVQGVGYTTLAKEFALPYVQSKQLILLNQGQTLDVHHYLVWYDRPEPPAYFSAIIDCIN